MLLHAAVFIPTLSNLFKPIKRSFTLPVSARIFALRSISWFRRNTKESNRFVARESLEEGGWLTELGWICADFPEKFSVSSSRRRCRSIAGERKARVRNVVVCTRHCRPYPPWLHGLHTRATVAAVPRSRLSSCALYSYVCVCVCVQVRSCAGCTPTCPRRRARVRVCSEREREREGIEGNWKDEGRRIERGDR